MKPDEIPFDRCEYLLPPGCKDLIDKIQLARAQSRRKRTRWLREKPTVHLPSRMSVRDLATALDKKLPAVIRLLKGMKVFTSVGQKILFYTAAKVASMYGYGYQAKKKGF